MFVINLSLALHLFHTIKELKSFKLALREKCRPIILMVLTTFIGFISLISSDLEVIRSFGMLTAALMLITSLFTVFYLYACSLFIDTSTLTHPKALESLLPRRVLKIKEITMISILSLIIGFLSFPSINIITDATQYFPKKSKIRENIIDVTKDVSGVPILEVLIENQGDQNIDFLNKILKVETKLINNQKISLLSNNQLIKKINMTYSKVDNIPQMRLAYLSLRSRLPSNLQESYPIENRYRITLLGSPLNVEAYEDLVQEVKKVLFEYGFTEIKIDGLYYHLMTAQKKMIETLFKSFLLSLFVISTVAVLYFKKLRVFWVFFIVNIIPVCLSFGLFKLLSLSFNIATVMTYSISLGLIVDGSFHVLHGIHHHSHKSEFYRETVSKPIFIGSLILSLAFMGFALNGFLPIRQFGISLGLIIFIGMFFDLMILPRFFIKKTN